MVWEEKIEKMKGYLEVIVTDHKTGELIRYDRDHNQIQDWAKHIITYLLSGRIFCTWGNHGEELPDGTQILHYKDGLDGLTGGDIVTASPWTIPAYTTTHAFAGMIQERTTTGDDQTGDGSTLPVGTPLYPFYPTKMRFGTGGLDVDQQPRVDIPTNQTTLNAIEPTYPFIVVDRQRGNDAHINLSESGSVNTINKVTFSCKLPGGDPSYPYNGKVISEAGLFCDAAMIPSGTADYNMRTGSMMAYRTFYGITKNESIDITFNWSFVM